MEINSQGGHLRNLEHREHVLTNDERSDARIWEGDGGGRLVTTGR